MRQRPDLKSVIDGMAQLGEIYLRIEAKIHALYAEDPKLFFQAREVMAKAGYIEDYPDMNILLEMILSRKGAVFDRAERSLFRRYGVKFSDPVLLQEVVDTYCALDDRGKEKYKGAIVPSF